MDIYIAIFATLLFSAYFSGMEIAFITANRLKIELETKLGSVPARITSGFLRKPSQFIGTMLVGNNIVLVMYGIFMARLLEPIMASYGFSEFSILLVETIVSTLIILFVGEFIPKSLFRINSNESLTYMAIPNYIMYVILWLPMYIMVGLSEFLIRVVFRVDVGKQEIAFGRVDLDDYIRELADMGDGDENELDHEVKIFQNALDFKEVKARDCMVPRTEIVAVEIETSLEKLRDLFVKTGHSKVLVYRDNIDNIIGYIHAVELFHHPDSIKRLIVPVIIIPETISAKEVLQIFIKQNKSLAVVVDEFGGTSGMLTIEDIIEQIFGDIEDEHDTEDFLEEQIDEKTFLLSARLEIDYLNRKYKFDLPEDDNYETLAGLIIHECEDIPELNSIIDIGDFRFTITAATNVRIETVKLQLMIED
jgi:CBS domain containing-hemolysin-like protein